MQFTEIGFAIFLPIVFSIYWLILRKSVRLRNLMLLGASYLFYGWWDWRFLILIVATSLTTYIAGLFSQGRHGKLVTTANIVVNLGILATFKYLGFFAENLRRLFSVFGWNLDWFTVEVLLPVGISFYTFQAIGYSVDTFKRRIKPCRDIISFFTFIAYFPQLVAGPIERAKDLLPQLQSERKWNRSQAVSGLQMILYGVMKKVAVADILAVNVDRLFLEANLFNPWVALIAGLLFSLEIYCDFSAYSEIARGTSRLLGIELMANFRFPYFSRNVLDFWRRWHISLMMWFRDYLYIPLGGNRKGKFRTYINVAIVFLLSGLWHGAAWNFIMWGAYWAVVNIGGRGLLRLKVPEHAIVFRDLPRILVTFFFVAFGFYIFRCQDWTQMAAGFINLPVYILIGSVCWGIGKILTCRGGVALLQSPVTQWIFMFIIPISLILMGIWYWEFYLRYLPIVLPMIFVGIVEWRDRNTDRPFSRMSHSNVRRYAVYWLCMAFVILSEPTDMSFIYFQF